MALDLDSNPEAQYLHRLAQRLQLSPDNVNQIHKQLGAPRISANNTSSAQGFGGASSAFSCSAFILIIPLILIRRSLIIPPGKSSEAAIVITSRALKEYQLIQRLAAGFRRSPAQVNPLFGSDSEMVRLRECGDTVIALTTDGVVEEIQQGLYLDPFLIGWMTVMVNLSDLAAVGARAEGVLIQLNLPPEPDEAFLSGLRQGIEAACRECGTYVLGGDVNSAAQLSTGGTAFGVVPAEKMISRNGCRSGDRLYTTAPAGLGSAFAFERVFGGEGAGVGYQPVARLNEGRVVREFASSCLDTSDGLIPGLAQLVFVNDVGFEFTAPYEDILHPAARALATHADLPPWFLMAGPHGDFELVFTLPVDNEADFLEAANRIGWEPLCLGKVVSEGLVLDLGIDTPTRTDATLIADLFQDSGGDSGVYLESLKTFHKSLLKRQ